jgi:YidC/Oxa1 family membrane protein insertase
MANGVRAEKRLANGLTVVKEFTLGTNYLVGINVRLRNEGASTLALPGRELVVGTATPLGPHDNGQYLGVMWHNGEKLDQTANQMWFANHSMMSCVGATSVPRTEYVGGSNNVAWVAAHNQYFTFAAVPSTNVSSVAVRPVLLPRDADAPANSPDPQGFQAALAYPAAVLAPGQVIEQSLQLFAGPKEYRTLAKLADGFKNNLDQAMGVDSVFPFYKVGGFFSKALLLAMNWVHDALRLPYGWAIIAITVVVKLVFWPLTAASTRSMKRMQQFQPQLKAIQEKHKDDPAKMNKKTMEFMRENKLNPVGGCLPMLIQMPIFIGFYGMIRTAIELRGAPFLWIGDLAQPDTLYIIPGLDFIPVLGVAGVGLPINLLPIIMGATQVYQMSLTPPSPGVDPAQQKMMKYMPLLFVFMLYNFSAGLTLYWTVQNLLSIIQTKLTKTEPATALVPAK